MTSDMTTEPSNELADALEACGHLGYAPVVTALVAEVSSLRDRVAELESAAEANLTTALAQTLTSTGDVAIATTPEQIREWVRQIGDPPIEIPNKAHRDQVMGNERQEKGPDMGAHIIDGEFQSDKYPTCPRGKVPLSVKDPAAQDLLWTYAQRRRVVDTEFSDDLETTLIAAGYLPIAVDRSNFDTDTLRNIRTLIADHSMRVANFAAFKCEIELLDRLIQGAESCGAP